MFNISIKQLLEAGVHFGHPTKKWDPRMAEYIFTTRNGIHIIDLQKTVKKFEEAYTYVRYLSEAGGTILFVGTKKQAAESIREEALKCGQYYVSARCSNLRMSVRKSSSTTAHPMKPSSSPTVQKMKSVSCSGTYFSFVCVPLRNPLPFSPPEPMAIFACITL